MFSKKTIIIMSVITGILIVFIIGLLIWQKHPSSNFFTKQIINNNLGNNIATQTPEASLEAGKQATGKLIDEIKNAAVREASSTSQPPTSRVINISGVGQAVQAAPGSSAVAVSTGKVTAVTGQEANNSAAPATSGAPQESTAINSASLPASSVKLLVTNNSITPSQFTVHPGQVVLLAITAGPSWTEVFTFESPLLSAVVVGVDPGETRAITFNAPTVPGEYVYFSSIGNHRASGSIGKMIVK
jgi:plastocyanin